MKSKYLKVLSLFLVTLSILATLSLTSAKTISADEGPWCGDSIGPLNVKNGVNTAFGCIRLFDENIISTDGADYSVFLSWILTWAIGLGGGIAFLLIIYAGFMIMTSSGDPERLKAGQELLTSAIMGLIMLIFSLFILEFIGVDILAIPGFGT